MWPWGQAVYTPPPSTSRVGWSSQAAARPLGWEGSCGSRAQTGLPEVVLGPWVLCWVPSSPSSLSAIRRWGAGGVTRRGVGREQDHVTPVSGVSILFGELVSLVENKYFLKTGISCPLTSVFLFFFSLLNSSKVGKIPKDLVAVVVLGRGQGPGLVGRK